MKSIILTYPSFQTLPKAIKQMLVASESDFFSDAKPARTAGGPGKLGHRQLFPALARIHERHRAKMFIKRLKTIGVSGISLHSYRYAWAERAMEAGYPERFAMQALGHTSKAIHRAYSRKAQVKLPPLEEYERKIVPLPNVTKQEPAVAQTMNV